MLIEHGADVNKINQAGMNCLQLYLFTNRVFNIEVVKIFIQNGVIINPLLANDSPLMIAAFRKLPLSTFQELIKAGADPNYLTPDGQNVISKLIYSE